MTSFTFYPVTSNFKNWTYIEVNKGDSLIVLKKMDLKNVNADRFLSESNISEFSSKAAFIDAPSIRAYWKIRNHINVEFRKTGKIKGFEVLNLQTFDKLWISHYDMKILLKNHD